MNTINQTIINKLQQLNNKNKLAPFYIFNGNYASNTIQGFIIEILRNRYNITKENAISRLEMGHQDIILLDKEEDKKEYSINDSKILQFYQFLKYSPIELNYKFAIFKNSHLINKILSNKLLKILEEPPKNFCIIFENNLLHSFLPTIESRAVNIYCNNTDPNDSSLKPSLNSLEKLSKSDIKFLDAYLSKEKNLQDFIHRYKDKKLIHCHLLKYFLKKQPSNNALQNNKLLNILKKFDRSLKFNRGTLELLALYSQSIINCDNLLFNNKNNTNNE